MYNSDFICACITKQLSQYHLYHLTQLQFLLWRKLLNSTLLAAFKYTVLLTIVIMLYIISPEFIPLVIGSL